LARNQIERRLAAILSADVFGYSRLMGTDEAGTLAALRAHRGQLIDPAIDSHGGRIVKLMGDGALVEFASVIDAVECALEIQHGMAVRNATVPGDRRIVFRIGVNLGDVIIEEGDIYGDGVNVAARLQEAASPGGIYVSGIVFEQIDGKIGEKFIDMGNQLFKNIAKPLRVYRAHLIDASSMVEDRMFFGASPAMQGPITGGCLCGNIRYEIDEAPRDIAYCHCRICQRWTGGIAVAGCGFRTESVRFTQGEPTYYRSSPVGKRGFCANCGSSLIFLRMKKGKESDVSFIYLAGMDRPEDYPPTWHLGIESQMPWLQLHDDLPRVRCKDAPAIVDAWAAVHMEVPEPNLR
jgi:adenylate cyclase